MQKRFDMLYKFLDQYKNEIIDLCKGKVSADAESKPTSVLLEQGLPIFYDELIEVLRRTAVATQAHSYNKSFMSTNRIKEGNAAEHGKESLRLGYSISQVVHSYGSVCQSITEFVQTKEYKVTSREFHDLNLSLDCAIAEAVTEFEKGQNKTTNYNEVERLGSLMHEMGNSLAAAIAAHEMIQMGHVGIAGSTSQVLSQSHERLRYLIQSVNAEIRLYGHPAIKPVRIRLADIIKEVETAAVIMKKTKEVRLEVDVDSTIQLTADYHLVLSALSNLVNNAMKFTKTHGKVLVRGKKTGDRILIEVEDECGGLPDGQIEDLFKPFTQRGSNKTGMGLGLSLSRRAIELNHGHITARNIPGKGCVFTIDLPKNEQIAIPQPV